MVRPQHLQVLHTSSGVLGATPVLYSLGVVTGEPACGRRRWHGRRPVVFGLGCLHVRQVHGQAMEFFGCHSKRVKNKLVPESCERLKHCNPALSSLVLACTLTLLHAFLPQKTRRKS